MKFQALENTNELTALTHKDWVKIFAERYPSYGVVDANVILEIEKIGQLEEVDKKTSIRTLLEKVDENYKLNAKENHINATSTTSVDEVITKKTETLKILF